jgi:hypothetical protein
VNSERRFRAIIGSPIAPATRASLGVIGVVLVLAAYEYYVQAHEQGGGNLAVGPARDRFRLPPAVAAGRRVTTAD